jgi:nicotinate-nucleotide--dimethylbenzimidazole phosphoribosyltransferase
MNDHAYSDEQRAAVYRVIEERRDVRRGFLPDPIPADVLTRVIAAAHRAPSVGLSQPWDFIVLADRPRRERIKQLADRARADYAASLPGARALAFDRLKTEAIMDTPVNIVVTCDPTRGGRHTLGRHSQPQTAAYSSVLAVANLWLAARAEGLGIGWVSFFGERELAEELGRSPSSRPPAGRAGGRWPGRSTRRSTAAGGCPGRTRRACWTTPGPRSGRRTPVRWPRPGSGSTG